MKQREVTILIRAGLCMPDNDRQFVAACEPGTKGVYVGPHPNKNLKHWHLVEVAHMGQRMIAPVSEQQFRFEE